MCRVSCAVQDVHSFIYISELKWIELNTRSISKHTYNYKYDYNTAGNNNTAKATEDVMETSIASTEGSIYSHAPII